MPRVLRRSTGPCPIYVAAKRKATPWNGPSARIVLPPTYFGGVVDSELGVLLVPEVGVEGLVVVGVVVLVVEVPDEDVVELLDAVLEALEVVAVGVVPVGVVNIGTRG